VCVTLGIGLMPGPASAELMAHHIECVALGEQPLVTCEKKTGVLCRSVDAKDQVPDLTPCGLDFVGGKLCQLDGRRVVHLVYRSCEGKAVSLFSCERLGGFMRRAPVMETEESHTVFTVRVGTRHEYHAVIDKAHCEGVRREMVAQLASR
jgi:anti-sigma factor RsiW